MVQMQSDLRQGFCKEIKKVESIYILAADSHQLFGQGMTDLNLLDSNLDDLPEYRICTKADSDLFLEEFIRKIHSDKLYSCQSTSRNRVDKRLQRCMQKYGLDR